MTIEHLLYTPSTSGHSNTMVMLVDAEMYDKNQNGEDVGSNASIMDSFDVFKYSNGNQGTLIRPKKSEISDVFGTTNVDEIADFMIKNGHCNKKSARNDTQGGDGEADPHSRMHVPRSGRPL